MSPPSSLTSLLTPSLSPLSQTEENTQEKKRIVSLPQLHTLFLERDNREVKIIVTELQSPFQSDELMASTSQIPTYPPSPAQNGIDGEAAVH